MPRTQTVLHHNAAGLPVAISHRRALSRCITLQLVAVLGSALYCTALHYTHTHTVSIDMTLHRRVEHRNVHHVVSDFQ